MARIRQGPMRVAEDGTTLACGGIGGCNCGGTMSCFSVRLRGDDESRKNRHLRAEPAELFHRYGAVRDEKRGPERPRSVIDVNQEW